VDSKQVKLMLLAVGAGAVLTMGVLNVASSDVKAAVPQPVPASSGETVTKSTAPRAPETSVALPPITTAPYTIPTGEPQ
jgi:hypothetical protein